MASSPKLISFFFLLTLFFIQIYARESQFFSKVSGTTNPTTTITTTINSKDNTFPNKEESFNKQEQDPAFTQETQNGYGLYGQESYDQKSNTQFPTTTRLANEPYTTTTTYTPYNTQTQTQSQKTYTNYPNTNSNYFSSNQYTNNYDQEQEQLENFGETNLQESSYTTMANRNNNNNNNKYYTYNGANGYNQQGKQGMSDTRYLENGKYYHDISSENNNYPNQYQNSNFRNNNYDTRAHSNYNNNENAYGYNKYSKKSQQEDFQDFQDEQYDP